MKRFFMNLCYSFVEFKPDTYFIGDVLRLKKDIKGLPAFAVHKILQLKCKIFMKNFDRNIKITSGSLGIVAAPLYRELFNSKKHKFGFFVTAKKYVRFEYFLRKTSNRKFCKFVFDVDGESLFEFLFTPLSAKLNILK